MSVQIDPPWKQKETESKANRWVPGMKSPNPKGRPKGIIDKRMKVNQALADDAPAIAQVVIDAAKAGDIQAASLVLSRIAPPIKARAERVQFELSKDRSLYDQASEIMQAISKGEVDPETGKILIGCVQSIAGIYAVQELEQRLITLEEKL